MDQPTYLNIVIRGTETDVKKAALAAMRRVNLETRGFNESLYAWADGMDFHERMDQIFVVLGKYDLRQIDDMRVSIKRISPVSRRLFWQLRRILNFILSQKSL